MEYCCPRRPAPRVSPPGLTFLPQALPRRVRTRFPPGARRASGPSKAVDAQAAGGWRRHCFGFPPSPHLQPQGSVEEGPRGEGSGET